MALEAADKAIICSAGQASSWFDWCWSLSIFFTFGFWWRLWLTYAVCQMMSIRQESVVVELHSNCHYECTIWILNQVWWLGCENFADYFYLAHTSFTLCVLFVARGPYVSMGIVACLVQLPAIKQCLNRLGSGQYHCGKHTSISVCCCWPIRVGIQYIQYGLYPFF